MLDIRHSALRTYKLALGGQASRKMLKLSEDVFRYEESPESIRCGEAQTPISTDSESETEGAGNAEGLTSCAHAQPTLNPPPEPGNEKTKEQSPSHHHPIKNNKHFPLSTFLLAKEKEKVAKKDTFIPIASFFMISEKAITMTGISSEDLLKRERFEAIQQEKETVTIPVSALWLLNRTEKARCHTCLECTSRPLSSM